MGSCAHMGIGTSRVSGQSGGRCLGYSWQGIRQGRRVHTGAGIFRFDSIPQPWPATKAAAVPPPGAASIVAVKLASFAKTAKCGQNCQNCQKTCKNRVQKKTQGPGLATPNSASKHACAHGVCLLLAF